MELKVDIAKSELTDPYRHLRGTGRALGSWYLSIFGPHMGDRVMWLFIQDILSFCYVTWQ